MEYGEFHLKQSKPIADDTDCVLTKLYGFTEEELDFIINYDIKHRVGHQGRLESPEIVKHLVYRPVESPLSLFCS